MIYILQIPIACKKATVVFHLIWKVHIVQTIVNQIQFFILIH